KTYSILRKPLQVVVCKIRQQRLVFYIRGKAHFILVNFPGHALLFQSLGECSPARLVAIVNFSVPDLGLVALGTMCFSRPEITPVGGSAGQCCAEMLITNSKGIGERIIERNVFTGVISHG